MNFFNKLFFHINNKTLTKKLDYYFCYKLKFYKILYFIFSFFKLNEKKVICDNFHGKGFSCNPKYIVEELHRRFPNYIIIWVFDFYHLNPNTLPDYVIPIQYDTTKELFHLATSKYWIFNYRRSHQLPKRKGQLYFQTWHGSIGPKMIEKDAVESVSKRYIDNAKLDSTKIDYCISGSKFLTNLFNKVFWYDGPVLEFGCPRNDLFFDKSKTDEIKQKLNLKSKKICMYAPTFRKDYAFNNYDLDYSKLYDFLNKNTKDEWVILLRFHPNIIFEGMPEDNPNVINVSTYSDPQELCLISDILITDYSSIVYDYMLQSKPAFIYASDYDDYIRNDRHLYFKITDTPFSIAKTTDELLDNIKTFNKIKYDKEVKHFLAKMGNLENGNASKKTVDFLLTL